MPTEWPVVRIEEVAADDEGAIAIGPFGSSMKADVYTPTGVPVVRGNNLIGKPGFFGDLVFVPEAVAQRFSRCLVRPGDLVFPHRGAIGEVGLVVEREYPAWMLSTSMMKLRLHLKKADPQYVYYFFRSSLGRHQLLKNASQVGTPGIGQPLTFLRACELPLPPLPEQRAIAGVLGSLDDKIEQNHRTAAKLEALARVVFRAWFVDFAPVHAKAAGATTYPGLPPAAFAALPTTFTDSPLGTIPEEWEVSPISKLAGLSTEQVNPQEHAEEVFDHFSIPAFDAGKQPIREVGDSIKSGKLLVPRGCVMISKLNPRIPRIWLPVATEGVRPIASTEFIVLVPETEECRAFLFGLLTQESFLNELAGHASGTSNSHQRLKPKSFMATDVVLPPTRLREAYAEVVAPMLDLVQQGRDESRQLAALRDYLLPRLLSGAVRVIKAERVSAGVV